MPRIVAKQEVEEDRRLRRTLVVDEDERDRRTDHGVEEHDGETEKRPARRLNDLLNGR